MNKLDRFQNEMEGFKPPQNGMWLASVKGISVMKAMVQPRAIN
jgi:hypothetical protein